MTAFHETPPNGPTADRARAMQALVPVIETERLILRAPMIEDYQVFASTVLGPNGKFFGEPKDGEEAWEIFIQIVGVWFLRGHGAWTITDRETGEVLGFVLIGAEPGDQEHELGYILTEAAQGKGFGAEATSAIRDLALGDFALPSLVSYVHKDNRASRALAERIGGQRDPKAEAALGEDDACVYRHVGGAAA